MTDPAETTSSSSQLMRLLSGLPAQDFTWEPLLHGTVVFSPQDTTGRRPEPLIAPTPQQKFVRVRCTLKLTSSLTLRDMERLSRDASFMLQTAPAIRALVSSSMREYQPWFSTVAIEMTLASDFWRT